MAWGKKTQPEPVVDAAVPEGMRIAGAWSWRILVVVGVVAVVIYLVTLFSEILIPFLIGIVVAALLVPLSNWMQRHHVPKWLAVIVSLVGGLAAVSALIWLVVDQIAAAYPSLRDRTLSQYDTIRDFVLNSGLGISQRDLNSYLDQATDWLQSNSGSILSGVASAGSSLTHILTGLFIVIFTVIFLLIDGKNVWRWAVRLFPKNARSAIDGAGVAGWTTLTSFIRVQIFVAFVDAVGIGLGAFILQLPLVVPIAVFVFLGSFIPVVGAIVTGFLAVFVALVFNGWVAAVWMLLVILIVQQVEGHILQPLVMGSAVKVHPLAVVLGVTAASGLAGIAGAFFAVPLIATVNSMVTTIASGRWKTMDSDHVREARQEAHDANVASKRRRRVMKLRRRRGDVPPPGVDEQPTAVKGTAG
ncbi:MULTISPECIES: AI-2E family transporter [Curtobacterium]|uniref:AI-2E family transporter n=1 Tax=Curtobacterium TaxID=2034 RepID=UPI0018E556DE|nr:MULTISPECIES: AI-2E family transporter [Curtobacterium]MCA5922151.1 AI-2E family transporter [Curtobacterium oceanosedimentum]QQD76879.1 AI-2E family transporter [Curtobacterium sp. YC1]